MSLSEQLYVGAYWSARAESVEACAARAVVGFERLASVDELLGSWRLKGARRAAARLPFDTRVESVMQALAAGRNRRDDDGSVIDALGFSLGVWNGDGADPVGLSIRCGISATTPALSNSVVVTLPEQSTRSAGLYGRPGAGQIVAALVEAWEPDWATVTSNSLREAQAVGGGRPVLGFVTYLSASRGEVPTVSAPFHVERLAAGSLISVDGDFAAVDSAAVSRLAAMLGPNLLRPTG